ncbi:TPA: prepilin-type N-terminal cleavage/methylation domain-containing protein [Legionella pneumophila]|nr:prepilin-type N-terminal cleavage/methylation domain-containing protein [Legionella pneumophila]
MNIKYRLQQGFSLVELIVVVQT